ncbi:MAG: hypothetical protein ACYDA3_14555 [Gaiellaceae bacterium]
MSWKAQKLAYQVPVIHMGIACRDTNPADVDDMTGAVCKYVFTDKVEKADRPERKARQSPCAM